VRRKTEASYRTELTGNIQPKGEVNRSKDVKRFRVKERESYENNSLAEGLGKGEWAYLGGGGQRTGHVNSFQQRQIKEFTNMEKY